MSIAGDPRRTDTFLKADIGPSTCVIIEDNGRRSPRKVLQAVTDAGGTLVYVLGVGPAATRAARRRIPRRVCRRLVSRRCRSCSAAPLMTEFGRSLTKARVQQYQRYFSDADRVLIMLHNDPDPDAMASGLALRNVLHRTKATAIIGAIQGVTRPENLRMVNLLDIHVEPITAAKLNDYDRIAMVDVQPHYFGGAIDRVDLVIDHHPEQPGYTADLQGHPRRLRIDLHDSDRASARGRRQHLGAHRHGDALRDQVGYAVLQPPDQPRRPRGVFVSVSAGGRRAHPQDGRRRNHPRAARLRDEGAPGGTLIDQVFCAFLGASPREDFIPYVADFFLQLEGVKWTIIAGIVEDSLVVSVRNLGYTKNAGEFVRRFFADIGSAGGHRAMAKAVVPMRRFREKYGIQDAAAIGARLQEMVVALPPRDPGTRRQEDRRRQGRRSEGGK